MTNAFRKHHKAILWVIIVCTILSFVYFLSPAARNNGGGGGGSSAGPSYGTINGQAISALDFGQAVREARLVYFLSQRQWPDRSQDDLIRHIAYQRLYIAAKLKELNLNTDDAAAANYTRLMLGLKPGQPFPKDQWDDFVKRVLNQGGVISSDFDHYVREQVGQMLLVQLYGMNGQLITDKEAEFFYRRENESMNVELVRFDASNYVRQIHYTSDELQAYYTNNQSDYRLPPREVVSYIWFSPSNYTAVADERMKGSNVDVLVDSVYSSSSSEYKDAQGNPLSEAAAKEKIRTEVLPRLYMNQAVETNANDLTTRLYSGHDKDHPITLEDMQKLAETNGLKMGITQPFDEKNPPSDLQLTAESLRSVFQLDFGDPDDQYKLMQASNGLYLIGLQNKLPSEGQPYEAVKAKVEADYLEAHSRSLAQADGTKFADVAKEALAAHQNFDTICAVHGFKPLELSPFSSTDRSIPEISSQQEFSYILQVSYDLPDGQVSQFVPLENGGFVCYMKSREPISEDIVKKELPGFLARFREDRQNEAFNQWLEREMRQHMVVPDAAMAAPLG